MREIPQMPKWVTIKKMAEITGWTVESIRANQKKGKLERNVHWIKAHGRIWIHVENFNEWISAGTEE